MHNSHLDAAAAEAERALDSASTKSADDLLGRWEKYIGSLPPGQPREITADTLHAMLRAAFTNGAVWAQDREVERVLLRQMAPVGEIN
jgi:uncharacterized protein YmfQ (DUF2313 family)